MKRAGEHRRAALAELGALLPLAMVGLLVANDRLLKCAFHNTVTGKLSDVAICFLMPLLVAAALGLLAGWSARARLWVGAAVTVIVFSTLEMSDVAGDWFRHLLGIVVGAQRIVLTRDPTDLLALACVPLAVAYGRRRARAGALHPRWASAAGACALVAGSLALMATSEPVQCSDWSAPMAFNVEGDCGAGGVIVVEADSISGRLTITNAGALLSLLPIGNSTYNELRYTGSSCPYAFDRGDWVVNLGLCGVAPPPPPVDAGQPGDGGDASAPGGDAGAPLRQCPPSYRACHAALEGDVLWFTCNAGDPNVTICRSRLTVLP